MCDDERVLLRNRYRLIRRLGAGGGGTVFEAEDTLTGGSRLALKALWPAAGDQRALTMALRSEFGVLATVRHPRLCRVYDFGRLPAGAKLPGGADTRTGGFFLTREIIDGADLRVAAADATIGEICVLLADAARSLEVLHAAGLRHGDFKPANAIVDSDGCVRLIDFGLSVGESVRRSAGTLAYLAPEVIERKSVDRRADLYALGIVLFELCAGALPSEARRGSELHGWHCRGARPVLSSVCEHVAPELDELVARLMDPDPGRRPPTAMEVCVALERCAAAHGAEPRPASGAGFVLAPLALPQLAELETLFEHRRTGHGGSAVVEVVGEEGCGKTTLLTELAWRLELSGVEVLRGGDGGVARPFGAIGCALDQLGALTGMALPTVFEQGKSEAHGAARAIARWLDQAARRWPIAILLDDADDATSTSHALAGYLAHAISPSSPILIVVVRRAQVRGERRSLGEIPRVELSPLAATQVEAMVHAAAGRVDESLARRVHRHTAGNLLHVVETLRTLAQRGFPPAEDLDGLALPPRLVASAEHALRGASDEERRVCETLAVIARPVPASVVVDVAARVGDELDDAMIHAATESALVVRHAGKRFALARRAVGQLVYGQIDPARLRALHGAAAVVLVEWAGLDPADPEVVTHGLRAGDTRAARQHGTAALATLRAAGDHVAALEFGRALLLLLSRRGSRVLRSMQLAVGELARLAGQVAAVESLVSPVLASTDADARDRARLTFASALEESGQPARAEQLWRAVVKDARASELRDRATQDLARLYIKRGQNREALELVDAMPGDQESLGLRLRIPRAYAGGILGVVEDAEPALLACAHEAKELGAHSLCATALNYAAILAQSSRGDFRSADTRQRAALDAARRAGDLVRIGGLRVNLASNAFQFGDYGGCLTQLVEAVSLLGATGADTPCVMARRNLGHLLVELGEYEQAGVELCLAQAAAARLGLSLHEAGTLALQGIAAHRAGDSATGRRQLEQALSRFEALDSDRHVSETLLDLIELALDQREPGALERAATLLERVDHMTATHDGLTRRARCRSLAAECAARRGDAEACKRQLALLAPDLDLLQEEHGRHTLWSLRRTAAAACSLIGDEVAAEQHRSAALAMLTSIAAGLPAAKQVAFWQDPRRRSLRVTRDGGPTAAFDSTWIGSASTEPSAGARVHGLLDIYRRMSSERDPKRLLDLVMATAIELSGAVRGFILLADGDDGRLRTAVARNLPAHTSAALARIDEDPAGASQHQGPYSRTIAERVFRSGEVVLSEDPRADPRFDRAQSVHELGLGSVVCIPVHARGRIAGVLYLESPRVHDRVADADLTLLMAFGDQVAILLDNARLLAENQRRADELAVANARVESLLAERTAALGRRTEELAQTRRDLASERHRYLGERGAFGIVGRSLVMERVFELIERLAAADVPVLVLGESGTGKELVARALHEYGPRKDAPMVSINCGALPPQLLESELFGHERGAFTGADRMRRGLFETASGGTLFLDEVGETPPRMQAALLRALQEGVIRRVGGLRDIAVDVRIVAATNVDLEQAVQDGRFREDLFYRLHVVPVRVPPLRERPDDVPLLAEHFLAQVAERTSAPRRTIAPRTLRALMAQPWPGNVRQLEHAITNAAVLSDSVELDVHDFSVLAGSTPLAPSASQPENEVHVVERRRILEALEQTEWNKSKAARLLQIPRRTFYRRLREYDIH